MAPKTTANPPPRHDDLDNYNVDDLSDDPFASPPSSPKKRKQGDAGLGIDEEVSVQKRARAPNVKLDEDRLLSDAGIPELRKRARNLKIKGKGHEFSDAARLLSFYQTWLDDLFPKAKFLDALAMVEKAGHKKKLVVARGSWLQERKPTSRDFEVQDENEVDDSLEVETRPSIEGSGSATVTAPTQQRPSTPLADVPDDDDLYDATPRPAAARAAPARLGDDDIPDDDEFDALMAEYGGGDREERAVPSQAQPARSNLAVAKGKPNVDDDDDDDLMAMMAESEQRDKPSSTAQAERAANSTKGGDEDAVPTEEEMEGLWE